jgi:Cu/Ag efflux protein CusF
MKRAMLTVMALAISVIFSTAVMAAEQKAPAPSATVPASSLEKYSGVVERVDVAKKDFSVKSGKEEMIFSWTDKTKITEGQKTLSFADLKKGQEVSVEYKKEGNKSVAEAISVTAPKTMGMKEKSPSSTKKGY